MKKYKPDFNRLRKVLTRDGEPDIVPFFEFLIDAEIITALTGKPVNAESTVEFYEKYGYDYVMARANYGYDAFKLAARDTAALSRGLRSYDNENEGPIQDRKGFDEYDWREIDKTVASPMGEIGGILPEGMKMIIRPPKGVYENVIRLMGYEPFSCALYEDRQLVGDMFERIGSNHLKIIRTCLENSDVDKIGAVALGDDLGYISGTMISPELLRQYVFPWYKEITDLAHSYGLPMILHSCGNIESVMDDLIDDIKLDAKHSFENKIMPVEQVKRKYGNRLAILGGVDMNVLCTESPAGVRKYVSDILAACAPGGGYALGTGNSVANYVPIENYLAMLDEGRK